MSASMDDEELQVLSEIVHLTLDAMQMAGVNLMKDGPTLEQMKVILQRAMRITRRMRNYPESASIFHEDGDGQPKTIKWSRPEPP